MKEAPDTYQELLRVLFREQYTKMTAVICRNFGLAHIDVAEDIVSDTFLTATETWKEKGIPDNPAAWLYAVAKNKMKDHLRRNMIFDSRVREAVQTEKFQVPEDFDFRQQNIRDSQLAMLFAVCAPGNSPEAQICLALQILCGFSVPELAEAFLTQAETIKKRLHRAKVRLREDHFQIHRLEEEAVRSRLPAVLRTLYLLFNEGYSASSNKAYIREELCAEAIRLALMLTEHAWTNSSEANALLGLMCFQSSRLSARKDDAGDVVLFEDQDKRLWDRKLIDRGNYYLVQACDGKALSKYHLEAAIAYWHTTDDVEKWPRILSLYDQLILVEYSPAALLNRSFAVAQVLGKAQAILEVEKLPFEKMRLYHCLLGYLYDGSDPGNALLHYRSALELTKSPAERKALGGIVERLEEKSPGS